MNICTEAIGWWIWLRCKEAFTTRTSKGSRSLCEQRLLLLKSGNFHDYLNLEVTRMLVLTRKVREELNFFAMPEDLRRLADELEELNALKQADAESQGKEAEMLSCITVSVERIQGDKVRIGLVAPKLFQILRGELAAPRLLRHVAS